MSDALILLVVDVEKREVKMQFQIEKMQFG